MLALTVFCNLLLTLVSALRLGLIHTFTRTLSIAVRGGLHELCEFDILELEDRELGEMRTRKFVSGLCGDLELTTREMNWKK